METHVTPQTPRTPRTPPVRRNLFTEFEENDSTGQREPAVDFDLATPICVEGDQLVGYQYDSEYRDGWWVFLKNWVIVVAFGASVAFGVYMLFPRQLVIEFTREFKLIVIVTILCVIFISILWKICRIRVFSTEQSRQSPTTTNRRTRPTSTPRPAYSTQLQRAQSRQSDVNISVKRVFKGDGTSIWSEFIRYFENVANLNQWTEERMRRILLTTLRDQAEAYAYGLPDITIRDYNSLKAALNQRFGHTALKDSYIAEAKLRRKRDTETFRDFGQAIEDLYRRAYPDNREYVSESSMKTFLDNCSGNDDFRLAVKRTRPKTLAEAVTAAMQEECIRFTENRKSAPKLFSPQVYDVRNAVGSEKRWEERVSAVRKDKKCFKCNSTQHLVCNCPKTYNENKFRQTGWTGNRDGRYNQQNGKQQLNQNRPRQ